MADFSFDIVSEVDLQEIDNVINQVKKEMANRYDFKGSKSSIDYNRAEKKITVIADDDFKLRAIRDMLSGKMSKRGISFKFFIFKDPQSAFEGTLRQIIEVSSGIPRDKAKELVQIIKGLKLKVQVQIDAEKLRVSSPKKDDLQAVIAHIRKLDFPIPLNFGNYR